MADFDLNVPFAEKEQAKALGARWNPGRKKWFVPDGQDIEPFKNWWPAGYAPESNALDLDSPKASENPAKTSQASFHLAQTKGSDLQTDTAGRDGLKLSQFLTRVQALLEGEFRQSVWIKAELASVQEHRSGHVYFELVETQENGQELAKTRAMLWRSAAAPIMDRFHLETGDFPKAGIEVLMQVDVQFHMQFGFSLSVVDIDPAFTLGNIEAQIREIRQKLQKEGLYDKNKAYAVPSDFTRVAVISPAGAAGLGDFRAEADDLAHRGLCEFSYYHAQFQGDKVSDQIIQCLEQVEQAHAKEAFDALIVIRGGGAKTDLHFLNQYDIAKGLAMMPLPVFCGIGHERDQTIIDEIVTQAFDTPSKVVNYIERAIFSQAKQVHQNWLDIQGYALSNIQTQKQAITHFWSTIQMQAKEQIKLAHSEVSYLNEAIRGQAQHPLQTAQQNLIHLQALVETHAQAQLSQAQRALDERKANVEDQAKQQIERAKQGMQLAYAEVFNANPARILARGFAMVKDTDNKPVSTLAKAQQQDTLILEFKDGEMTVKQE